MTSSRGRLRASVLATAVVIVTTSCSSQVQLTPVPPGAEPGYPQYSTPTLPIPSDPQDGSTSPVETPSDVDPVGPDTSPSPASTTLPTPDAGPTPGSAPTSAVPPPQPTGSAEPPEPSGPPPAATAPAPAPTSSPEPPAPTTPPVTAPAPLTLTMQTWQPSCGAPLTAPAGANPLTVGVTLPRVASGGFLQTEAVLTSTADAPTAPERLVASVTVARDGVVVSTWAEGQDAGPEISVAARGTLVVPVSHDLLDSCSTPPASLIPPPEVVTAGGGTTLGSSATTSEDPAPTARTASGAQQRYLPAGEYTAVVAVHAVRAGSQATTVVATSGVVPLTIS